MKGRLVGLDPQEKKQTLTIELYGDFRDTFDELNMYDVEVTVKKYRKKRSLDQNGYMWQLLDQLSAKLAIPKETIYRECIRNIGGVSETVCVKTEAVKKLTENWKKMGVGWISDVFPNKTDGFMNVTLYYGSSTYDSEQMSRLVELVVNECKENGIETMTPAELEALETEARKRNS